MIVNVYVWIGSDTSLIRPFMYLSFVFYLPGD